MSDAGPNDLLLFGCHENPVTNFQSSSAATLADFVKQGRANTNARRIQIIRIDC
jgi:hypothetical protein